MIKKEIYKIGFEIDSHVIALGLHSYLISNAFLWKQG
jgi:hypothetical protein